MSTNCTRKPYKMITSAGFFFSMGENGTHSPAVWLLPE
jgi:hypothetical protein